MQPRITTTIAITIVHDAALISPVKTIDKIVARTFSSNLFACFHPVSYGLIIGLCASDFKHCPVENPIQVVVIQEELLRLRGDQVRAVSLILYPFQLLRLD